MAAATNADECKRSRLAPQVRHGVYAVQMKEGSGDGCCCVRGRVWGGENEEEEEEADGSC
jgi:hypothetical protein